MRTNRELLLPPPATPRPHRSLPNSTTAELPQLPALGNLRLRAPPDPRTLQLADLPRTLRHREEKLPPPPLPRNPAVLRCRLPSLETRRTPASRLSPKQAGSKLPIRHALTSLLHVPPRKLQPTAAPPIGAAHGARCPSRLPQPKSRPSSRKRPTNLRTTGRRLRKALPLRSSLQPSSSLRVRNRRHHRLRVRSK